MTIRRLYNILRNDFIGQSIRYPYWWRRFGGFYPTTWKNPIYKAYWKFNR